MSGVLVFVPPADRQETVRLELPPGASARFGRGQVEVRLHDPAVPRLAGEILAVDDHWRLSNFSADRTYLVENPEGAGEYLRIPPRRASYPVPFEFSRVVLPSKGPAVSFQVYAPAHLYLEVPDEEDADPDGGTTIAAFSLDEASTYFLVLVALCEPRLRDESAIAVPTTRQVTERLGGLPREPLTQRAVNFHIDYMAEEKLRVKQPHEETRQDGKREAVVALALRFGLVREEHLRLLPARGPSGARPARDR